MQLLTKSIQNLYFYWLEIENILFHAAAYLFLKQKKVMIGFVGLQQLKHIIKT